MDIITAEIEETKAIGLREKLAAYVELTKPRIAFMLVLTSAAGFYLGSTQGFNFALFTNAMIGIALLAFGVATLNQYIERKTDALMDRTARRPLPTNKILPNEALVFGIVQCAVAELYLLFLVNGLTAFLGLIVIVGYVLLYTPLKTRTSASTAIGALPGAMPPLMGWTSAADSINLGAWTLFALLFLWQFPHFLAIACMYKEQYAKAGIKDAAGARKGRQNYGAADCDVLDPDGSREPRAVFHRHVGNLLFDWREPSGNLVFMDEHRGGPCQNRRKITQAFAGFGALPANNFCFDGF
jgi:protoheme IX farnesyltransferase